MMHCFNKWDERAVRVSLDSNLGLHMHSDTHVRALHTCIHIPIQICLAWPGSHSSIAVRKQKPECCTYLYLRSDSVQIDPQTVGQHHPHSEYIFLPHATHSNGHVHMFFSSTALNPGRLG